MVILSSSLMQYTQTQLGPKCLKMLFFLHVHASLASGNGYFVLPCKSECVILHLGLKFQLNHAPTFLASLIILEETTWVSKESFYIWAARTIICVLHFGFREILFAL